MNVGKTTFNMDAANSITRVMDAMIPASTDERETFSTIMNNLLNSHSFESDNLNIQRIKSILDLTALCVTHICNFATGFGKFPVNMKKNEGVVYLQNLRQK